MDGEKELKKRLQIIGSFTDGYYGEFLFDNEKFKVFVSKRDNNGSAIKFARLYDEYPDGFWNTYNYRDTIYLNNRYLQIDTLLQNPTEIVLKPLTLDKHVFGYKEGFKLKNYQIEDLAGNKVYLKELSNKKLLLLDFWGTWCVPCMELTPDLKALYSKYKSKLDIVSIAFQEEAQSAQDYITKNNIRWFNGIVKGKPKTFNPKEKVIRELKVRTFPGFFVVDRDFNIVYRTYGGGENFKNLVEFIESY
jgi:thiol-disulfide isomerase/thioredoxin